MISAVKEAPAEQMVLLLALESSALLSRPTGTAWHIKLLSFYLVFVWTGSLFGLITQLGVMEPKVILYSEGLELMPCSKWVLIVHLWVQQRYRWLSGICLRRCPNPFSLSAWFDEYFTVTLSRPFTILASFFFFYLFKSDLSSLHIDWLSVQLDPMGFWLPECLSWLRNVLRQKSICWSGLFYGD